MLAHRLILGPEARAAGTQPAARARSHRTNPVPYHVAALTERGRLVLFLAGGIYLVAWAFGSRSLYPAPIGLALAAIGARLWVARSSGSRSR